MSRRSFISDNSRNRAKDQACSCWNVRSHAILPSILGVGLALLGMSMPHVATGQGRFVESATVKPNIVFIMMDDLDYADLGVYGSPDIRTPAIDAVASEGMRFEHYYANAPVCSPTRIAFLTGEYPERYGVHRAITARSNRGIPAEKVTLPEVLDAAGYRTAHVGKWHVGESRPEFLPTHMGFDESVRIVVDEEAGYYGYDRFQLSIDDASPIDFDGTQHLTATLTDHAVDFLEESLRDYPEEPFFLNLWYFAPHDPVELPADYDNAQTGYCLDPDDCGPGEFRRGEYAALVTNLDRQIARVLQVIDRSEELRANTLVIIGSDNGGTSGVHNPNVLPGRSLRGYKSSLFEGGLRVPLIVRWPGSVPAGAVNLSVVASFDVLPTLAEAAGADPSELEVDGESFLDVIRTNRRGIRTAPLLWENTMSNTAFRNTSGIQNTYAVRRNDWKLVYVPARNVSGSDSLMLFNLAEDPGERRNLLQASDPPRRSVSLFGYRLSLEQDMASSSGGAAYQVLVAEMQQQYYQWRREMGRIDYSYESSPSGVERTGERLAFDGGVVSIAHDTRLDFSEYDFSFAIAIQAAPGAAHGVIAVKPGHWRLAHDAGSVHLTIEGVAEHDSARSQVVLSGPLLSGEAHHVAFTVTGWRASESTVRLYVNGVPVAEAAGDESIARARPGTESGMPDLYIGSDSDGAAPFLGSMALPEMSVLGWYPAEVMWEYTRAMPISTIPTGIREYEIDLAKAPAGQEAVDERSTWMVVMSAILGAVLVAYVVRSRLRRRTISSSSRSRRSEV
jgi:arylsulfatase A-like enzyme